MTAFAADIGDKYPLSSSKRDRLLMRGRWPIGATGAVGTADVDDPQIVLTRAAEGSYTLTYPKCVDADVFVFMRITSTIQCIKVTAQDAAAGTAAFKTMSETADALADDDPASGDQIAVWILAETRS